MNQLEKIYYKADKWLRPYRYHFENEAFENAKSKGKRKKQKIKGRMNYKLNHEEEKAKKEFLKTGGIGIELVTINKELNNNDALNRLLRSNSQMAYYFHDEQQHQIAVKFDAGSSAKYHVRNDTKRKGLDPIIEHKKKDKGDKTHLIPIGFHGSDSDERLLVRFDSNINRIDLRKEEEYIAKINKKETIMWFVDIIKQSDDTAIWNMIVWDESCNIISQKSFHDKNKFNWS